jgi:hypothetical protein
LKYIHFENIGLIIFDESISHIEMKRLVGRKAISAGFFACEAPRCFGKSDTLQLRSQIEDAERFKGRSF